MAKCININADKNTTAFYKIEFKNTNITGWKIFFTLKKNMKDSDVSALINKTVTDHVDATNGKTLIELDKEDLDIDAGNYYYSVDYLTDKDSEGIIYYGKFRIKESTRKSRI